MEYSREERAIIYLSEMSGKNYRSCIATLRAAEDISALLTEAQNARVESWLANLAKNDLFAITIAADDYPESLKYISDPPLILYGCGNRALLQKRRFCIVGSRITPPWAEKLGKKISSELTEHFVIVTGLAEGGDLAAIEGALPSGNLISVLPCGLNRCYPAAHFSLKQKIKEQGLLLSEFRPDEGTARYSFPARNRLLAGMSEGVLVLSAATKSGALMTANRGLEYGKDVFALPYNPGITQGDGCNDLIKKGAFLVTHTEDILACYGLDAHVEKEAEVTEDEGEILRLLRTRGEMHPAEIAAELGLKVYEISSLLSALEIKGLAVKSGGNQYSAV